MEQSKIIDTLETYQPLIGQELHRASYGPKDVMGHTWARSENRLESYWMAQMTLLGLIRIGRNGPWVSGL